MSAGTAILLVMMGISALGSPDGRNYRRSGVRVSDRTPDAGGPTEGGQ
jgi:hypothetical protein